MVPTLPNWPSDHWRHNCTSTTASTLPIESYANVDGVGMARQPRRVLRMAAVGLGLEPELHQLQSSAANRQAQLGKAMGKERRDGT